MSDRIPGGVLTVDKPQGMTSHDVVNKVRKLFGTRQVGHTGTLDPMATGVIVVLVGNATKACEFALASKKEYLATFRLGEKTDTGDATGNVTASTDVIPSFGKIKESADSFKGEYLQTPPMYSALKRDGKKLVDLAREGVSVDREPRTVSVYSIECGMTDDRNYSLKVVCSKGTYIRTLCEDIAERAGSLATMTSLRRISNGMFSEKDALTIERLEEMSPEERVEALVPVESLFAECPKITLEPFYSRLARNGAEIYQKKIGTSLEDGTLATMYDGAGFFAVGRVTEFEDGSAVKPVKFFI